MIVERMDTKHQMIIIIQAHFRFLAKLQAPPPFSPAVLASVTRAAPYVIMVL